MADSFRLACAGRCAASARLQRRLYLSVAALSPKLIIIGTRGGQLAGERNRRFTLLVQSLLQPHGGLSQKLAGCVTLEAGFVEVLSDRHC
ncbi:MAG: hypothetical protein E5W41_08875 [Mesorhizobium sp.]|nr:MAG: hypothetical protein E5W41_08875 [Mesorhizobium sp.]